MLDLSRRGGGCGAAQGRARQTVRRICRFFGEFKKIRASGGAQSPAAHTDGPYAETKEQLGGYYLIEARDLNEAIQTAAGCPSARFGSVEVRPIWQMQV